MPIFVYRTVWAHGQHQNVKATTTFGADTASPLVSGFSAKFQDFIFLLQYNDRHRMPCPQNPQTGERGGGLFRLIKRVHIKRKFIIYTTVTKPSSQTQSSWSMIPDFINDDIFIVIFTSSWSNDHNTQICTLIGIISTSSANRVKRIFI